MARRRENTLRLDLSELDINTTLLEDLRFYVGQPENYVPLVFESCVRYLRKTKRMILTESLNSEDLDDVYDDFFTKFDERKFRYIVNRDKISIRMSDYKERVADFYYDIFDLIYSQVATYVNRLAGSNTKDRMFADFTCEVLDVTWDEFDDGFGICSIEQFVDIRIKRQNLISKDLLQGSTYVY